MHATSVPLDRTGAAWRGTLHAAEVFCHRFVRRSATNFYWGFVALPRAERVAIYALYGFSRQVDDEADAIGPDRLRERLLVHRERVRRCMRGEYGDPVMQVLAYAVRRYAIPEMELMALIDGVEMDAQRRRYRTWDDLSAYCRLVASVVGRMCIRIFGYADPAAFDRADELGLAMQLTNCLRDVREDAQMGRIYLPQQDLERFGIAEGDLLDGRPGPGWNALVAFEVERARALFATGLRVAAMIPRRPAACVLTMARIYERLLARIARDPALPLRARAYLSPAEKLGVVVRSWLRTA